MDPSPLDAAVATARSHQKELIEREAAEREPVPRDEVVDEMLRDFAARMPLSMALPFVVREVSEFAEKKRTGLFRQETRRVKRWTETETARGWPLGIGNLKATLGYNHDCLIEGQYGLAVATDGAPFFAVWDKERGVVIVGGQISRDPEHARGERTPVLGPPTGRDIRSAIISNLRLRAESFPGVHSQLFRANPNCAWEYRASGNGLREFPAYLAQRLAHELQTADALG